MNTKRLFLTALALSLPLGPAALAAAPQAQSAAASARASWTAERLSRATFVVLAPEIQGNKNLVTGDQLSTVLTAMKNDSAAAIKRRYPGATIATDPNMPGAIRVTPVLYAPSALVPWATMSGQWRMDFPEGGRVLLNGDRLNVLTVYGHGGDAANFVFDGVARKLP